MTIVILKKGTLIEINASIKSSCRTFLKMTDGGKDLLMGEDSAHGSGSKSELVVLGSTRKQTEQAMMSKPLSSTPPWPSITFCLQVPPPLFEELKQDSTFFFL